jgi:hypothetical protein
MKLRVQQKLKPLSIATNSRVMEFDFKVLEFKK